jgi:hypothetical protein
MMNTLHAALVDAVAEHPSPLPDGEPFYRLAAIEQAAEELNVVIALLGRKGHRVHHLACGQLLRISARLRAACALTSDLEQHQRYADFLEHQALSNLEEEREVFRWTLRAVLRDIRRDIRMLETHRKNLASFRLGEVA